MQTYCVPGLLILASILQSYPLKICHVLSLKLRRRKFCAVGMPGAFCLSMKMCHWALKSCCSLLLCMLHILLQNRLIFPLHISLQNWLIFPKPLFLLFILNFPLC